MVAHFLPYEWEKSARMLHVRFVLFSKRRDEHALFGINAITIRRDGGQCDECRNNPIDGRQSCPTHNRITPR